jgi:hypothetical protein
MMEIVTHSTCNDVLGVSAEQAAEGVVPLPINRSSEDGLPCVESFWKPDALELAAINAGHPILVRVMGHRHPPIFIGVAGDKE